MNSKMQDEIPSGQGVGWEDVVAELTHEKVALLRYATLSQQERLGLKEKFARERGRTQVPSWPVIPEDAQRLLEHAFGDEVKVPTKSLATLLHVLGMKEQTEAVKVPGTREALDVLTKVVQPPAIELKSKIADYYAPGDPGGERNRRIRNSLKQLYQDLSMRGEKYVVEKGEGVPDLLIVFGARSPGAEARAKTAADIVCLQERPQAVRVFISGWHPYYDSKFTLGGEGAAFLPFGEAEAMAVAFEEQVNNGGPVSYGDSDLPRLVLDPRARNTLETIVHVIPVIMETRAAKGEALNIQLVTAPYHARRTYNLAVVQLNHFLHYEMMVNSLTCVLSGTRMDERVLLDEGDSEKQVEAIALYVQEAVKLIGGRLTGEF